MYQISCFADEIAPRFTDELDVMDRLQVRWLSLRTWNDVNVVSMTDEQVAEAARELKAHGIGVSSIGSPIGKSPITDKSGAYLRQTQRAIEIARKLDCKKIRVFSFYMEPDEMDTYREEVLDRLSRMAELGEQAGIEIMHENEAGIYGQKSARCRDLLTGVNRKNFTAVLDPSNFVAAGEDPLNQSLPQVKEFVSYLHIKDSRHSDGVIVPAGEGDGHVGEILKAFEGKDLFLTLEPHLAEAGRNRGYSGAELFERAYNALTGLLKKGNLRYA